jgi:hypothetical protein
VVDDTGSEPVSGVVDSIDDDLARVLIGPGEEEWFFPIATLPDGVVEGNVLELHEADGRYVADGFVGTRQTENSIEERLSRGINRRRTAEMRRSDLRAAIDKVDGSG